MAALEEIAEEETEEMVDEDLEDVTSTVKQRRRRSSKRMKTPNASARKTRRSLWEDMKDEAEAATSLTPLLNILAGKLRKFPRIWSLPFHKMFLSSLNRPSTL
jgi:hypothetical protein